MSVEEFIIAVYCLVDDIMNELLNSKSLRQRGFNPALTDSEMIAMELVAEFQGIDTIKGLGNISVTIGVRYFQI